MCLNETNNEAHICKHLSDTFFIQNGLQQEVALSPLFFNLPLEYAIWKVQENQKGLKLNGTHQFLLFPHHVNLIGKNINAIKRTHMY
jgi:hypothetical protein